MSPQMLGSAAAEPGKTPDEGVERGVFPTAKHRIPQRTASTATSKHTQTHTSTQTHKHRGYLPTVRRPVIDCLDDYKSPVDDSSD